MINKKLVKALLTSATLDSKTVIIEELLNHISMNYDYNDQKAGHILEMLVDTSSVIRTNDINMDYIKDNPKILTYKHEEYNIIDIKVVDVDNIDCNVRISFKYIEKINGDIDDANYKSSAININYLDNPEILK